MKKGDWVVYKHPTTVSRHDGMLGQVEKNHREGWQIVKWCLWPPTTNWHCEISGELETYLLPVGDDAHSE